VIEWSKEEIVHNLQQAGVVGAGGAGFPTYVKAGSQAEWVIANAAECEPLLRSNQELLIRWAGEVLKGLRVMLRATGARKAAIGIKVKHKAAVAALQRAMAGDAVQPAVAIHFLGDFYPAGDEHAIVAEVTGRIVPEASLPLDVGVVVQNVETLANIAAALQRQPVTHKWVTVTGAVRTPVTLKVPVGTPYALLVQAAGGATVPDYRIVDGGPMMGKVITDPARPITKTTGGVIVLPRDHTLVSRPLLDISVEKRKTRTTCIHCRMCTDLCPRYLQGHDLRPHEIMQALALFPLTDKVYDQASLCCECGICEVWSCPMGLSPRLVLGYLKREFSAQGRRYPKQAKTYKFRTDAQYRRIPGKRLLGRMGLSAYAKPAPYRPGDVPVRTVMLLLRQHIGAPAVPVVREGEHVAAGQLVAEVPAGKLGAPVHASISGWVTQVTAEWVKISGAEVTGNA